MTLFCGSALFFLVPADLLFAAVVPEKKGSSLEWNKGVDYLEDMLTSKEMSFDVQKMSGLLDFVVSSQGGNAHLDPGKRDNATGAYCFFNVNAPLSKVVKYAYNPKIPAYVTLPSVVRFGGWQVKPDGPFDGLWEKVGNVKDSAGHAGCRV